MAIPPSPSPASPEIEPRYGWIVVWASFTALAVIFGIAYSFAAFFESFAKDFDATRAQVSLVFGLSGLLYFVLGAFGGMLSDRYGPRVVTSAGMVCIAAALVLGSRAGSMTELTLVYGIALGVGIALVYTPAIGCVQPWFARRRGLAAGIASAGIGAGTFGVPLLAAAAIAQWQWRHAMWALSAGVLIVGLGATLLLRRAPSAVKRADGSVPGSSLGEAVRSSSFGWLYAMCVLAAPAMFIPFAHLSASARDLGVAPAQAIGLVGLIGIGSLTGRFAIGAIADRLGRPATLIGVQASLGLSMLLWLGAGGYPALAVFALWMGLSYGGIVSLMPALCMDLYGARAVSSIIGALYTGAALGNVAGPWVAGRVFDARGSYALVIAGCAGLSLLATIATWRAVGAGAQRDRRGCIGEVMTTMMKMIMNEDKENWPRTRQRLHIGRRLRRGIALVASLSLLHAQTAFAWSNHALLTWPALQADRSWAAVPAVRVESLDTFLAAEASGLADLLRDEEAWAVQHVPNYPPRPAALAFRADAAMSASARRAAFIPAVRINPASKLSLFLQLPPSGKAGDRPLLKEADVTPLTSTEASKFDTFVALREGESVPVIDVIATATDEPDYGLDVGVWADNGTAHGAAYGMGKQPFGNPTLEFSSQAPLHIGYFHESAIVYKAAPFLARTLPEARIHLWRSLAAYALRTGHDYWGWRFAGWGLHYVQDLTQPYHARVLPGVGVARMLWINTIDLAGVHGPKAHAITFVTNRHLALENFELHWLRSVLSLPTPGDDPALRALQDATNDPRDAWRDDWPRERVSQQSADAADAIDSALVAALPARITSDPSYAYGVTETGLNLFATSTPQARDSLIRAIAPLLVNAAGETRAYARSLRPANR